MRRAHEVVELDLKRPWFSNRRINTHISATGDSLLTADRDPLELLLEGDTSLRHEQTQ
jgi:hypothetical protein